MRSSVPSWQAFFNAYARTRRLIMVALYATEKLWNVIEHPWVKITTKCGIPALLMLDAHESRYLCRYKQTLVLPGCVMTQLMHCTCTTHFGSMGMSSRGGEIVETLQQPWQHSCTTLQAQKGYIWAIWSSCRWITIRIKFSTTEAMIPISFDSVPPYLIPAT